MGFFLLQSKIEGEMILETATFRSIQRNFSGNWTCVLPSVGSATANIVVTGGKNLSVQYKSQNNNKKNMTYFHLTFSGEASASLQHGVTSSSCSLILSLSSTYQKLEAFLLLLLLAITSWSYNNSWDSWVVSQQHMWGFVSHELDV